MAKRYALSLWINGAPVKADGPSRVYPGRSNHLEAAWSGPHESAVLRVEVIAPDGRSRYQTAPLASEAVSIPLGPWCAPACYEYEAGVMFRRGYQIRVTVEDAHAKVRLARMELSTVCSQEQDAEWLMPAAPARCVYNDGYVPEGGTWNPFGESAGAMEPALQMRLDRRVLVDQDHVVVWRRVRPEPAVDPMPARLHVRGHDGRDLIAPVELTAQPEWGAWPVDVADWAPGSYVIELQPVLDGTAWSDGPRLTYRRHPADPGCVRVSPLAPFSMQRDETREEITIRQWPDPLPRGWTTVERDGQVALLCGGDPEAPPVRLTRQLEGAYAVFIRAVNTIHVRVGEADVVRRVHEPELQEVDDMFTHVADLTGQAIELYPNDLQRLIDAIGADEDVAATILDVYRRDGTRAIPFDPDVNGGEVRSGVRSIRLTPVTDASVRAFREATANPPYELRAVDDWWCHFLHGHRADAEQLDVILRGQREVGIKTLNWSVGRSCVQYPSRLPDAQMFPCTPIETTSPFQDKRQHWAAWEKILQSCDALGYPLDRRGEHDVRIQGWLTMNRHYGVNVLEGKLTSAWAANHPEYYQCRKDLQSVDYTRMEYYFPEVRKERLDILEEVAGYGPDGLVIGCCRQPPMVSYNPTMVEAYRKRTGVDPTTIDIEDGQPYLDWIQWRADFFTELLRELAGRLQPIETKLGRPIPVVARVPGIGLLWNLAEGLDVATWVREGLIDELQLDPLECAAGHASHDVQPYLTLCRAYGVPVFGGVNGATGANRAQSPVVGLRRAIGLLRAGVDGLEIYEAELFARCCETRWLIPLWGDPDRAERWLAESNLDAVYPITARSAALGHDNHWFGAETMHGAHHIPRGAKRPL